MAKKLIVISEDDRRKLKELFTEFMAERTNTVNRPAPGPPNWQTPEVYVCLTPPAGIPALTEGPDVGSDYGYGDVPPSRSCDIWQIRQGILQPTFRSITVYNLGTVAIAGGVWITPFKDKYGSWVIPNQGLLFTRC